MRFKLTARMEEIRRQRDEAIANRQSLDAIPCSLVDFNQVSQNSAKIAQLGGYLAALEFAIDLLDGNNE